MKKALSNAKELFFNIRAVMKLAYQVDPKLIVLYYTTAALGGIAPFLAAFLLKLCIDNLILSNQQSGTVTTLTVGVFATITGYYLIRVLDLIFYWGLNFGYYDYLLRNKLQNHLMYIATAKQSGGFCSIVE